MEQKWTAIVLTCQNKNSAQVFHNELKRRQQKGFIHKDVLLLAVEDPRSSVGSGGATLNALLVVTEHISAQQGYTVVNADVLLKARILILHMGREFPFEPCGRAFVTLPQLCESDTGHADLVSNIDRLLNTLTEQVYHECVPGIYVCSTDMFLSIPKKVQWPDKVPDVCAISVPASVEYAKDHGVYKVAKDGTIENIIYQGTSEELETCLMEDGTVPLVSGLLYFSPSASETLLSFHVNPPLDACTYMGLDSGAQPIQLSLFFDFMLPMCCHVDEVAYVSGGRSGFYGKAPQGDGPQDPTRLRAKTLLWKELQKTKAYSVVVPEGKHSYMDLNPSTHHQYLIKPLNGPTTSTHYFINEPCNIGEQTTLINSVIEENCSIGSQTVISHCVIPQKTRIGSRCIFSGLNPAVFQQMQTFPELDVKLNELVIQAFRINHSGYVLAVYGLKDHLQCSYKDRKSLFCNRSWKDFFNETGISSEDLWEDTTEKTLMTAKLFGVDQTHHVENILMLAGKLRSKDILKSWRENKRLSLKEILINVQQEQEFKIRRDCFFEVTKNMMTDTLNNSRNIGLNNLYNSLCVDGYGNQLMDILDQVVCNSTSAGVAARGLANIADVLSCMAHGEGGLRSGPASNDSWTHCFTLLEEGRIKEGVERMVEERSSWLDRPDLLIRAARHYERAAQILIRHAVKTARKFIVTSACEPPAVGVWVTARCPARIDLSGGWSDTPPITYEHGGAVTIAAITIDGKKPIGAKVRRIVKPHIILRIISELGQHTEVVITELDQMRDYYQPHAPGALLKSAFLCTDIITLDSNQELSEQLTDKYSGGFELVTWSELPHGSGLGTSSILSGAVMAVLWKASGHQFDIKSLNHAVLHLEQMLTTGGGWQDQVGGLIGGLTIAHSPAEIPVHITADTINVTEETLQAFNDRLVMVYTGKTRLARNLLQNVVRNWYARNPEIVETEDALVANAWKCAGALEKGDLLTLGSCIDTYWEQKKTMAPGCEPHLVRLMMDALHDHVYGVAMAGAGGGGFLYTITKKPNDIHTVREVLSNIQGVGNITVHKGSVDSAGLEISTES